MKNHNLLDTDFFVPLPLLKHTYRDIYSGELETELVACRACFYFVMQTVLHSVETQRKGVVSILYGVDSRVSQQFQFKFPRTRVLQTIDDCFSCVPLRVSCFHFCSNDIRLHPYMYIFQVGKFKEHFFYISIFLL